MGNRFRHRRTFSEYISHVNYLTWKSTEAVFRKLLLLGPDNTFDWLEPLEYGSGVVNPEKLSAHIDNHDIKFHSKPRREHYMDKTLRFMFYEWYQPIVLARREAARRWNWFLFFRARRINWSSHHYINRQGNDQIDGYVHGAYKGFRFRLTVDICAASCLSHDFWGEEEPHYRDLNKYGSWGFPTLMLAKQTVDYEDLGTLLNKWYGDLVRYKYRHWTWEGDSPKIVLYDLKFTDDLCSVCFFEKNECHCGEEPTL
jgi:hypothetical protein